MAVRDEAEERAAGVAGVARRKEEADKAIRARRRHAIAPATLDKGSAIKHEDSWDSLQDRAAATRFVDGNPRTGIALSGGGIRSATLSLGLVEALAARGRFYGFDLMSTVSGGGYCGSFLRSLFVARQTHGNESDVVKDRIAFADATLTSLPDQQYFRGLPGQSPFIADSMAVKNPLWWLRENGRYLAPGGMSGYGFALSYIIRNWVTLVIYLLAVMMVGFALLQLALLGVIEGIRAFEPSRINMLIEWLRTRSIYTPLAPMLLVLTICGTGIAASYWLTLPLPFARPKDRDRGKGRFGVALLVVLLLALLGAIVWLHDEGRLAKDVVAESWIIGIMATIPATLVFGAITWIAVGRSGVDFRREQTLLLANYNLIFLIVCGAAVIDGLALWLRYDNQVQLDLLKSGVVSGALASLLSFLIAKLPDWMGDDSKGIRKFLAANARNAALVAAIVILASIALIADMLVIKLMWTGPAWGSDERTSLAWHTFGPVMGLVLLFAFLFSRSVNFVNLLALTPFYGSRLTRTYLGASNVFRLDADNKSEVTHGMEGDDIDLHSYMTAEGPAPLHLINVTRNRTVGDLVPQQQRIDVPNDDPLVREDLGDPRGRLPSYESSLTLYDRHGDRVVFGPFGVRVGAEFYRWEDLEETPSLGLLCAISGAAVGSGMGRQTSLGTAMALTLANMRLGYWWKEQRRKGPPRPAPWHKRLASWVTGGTKDEAEQVPGAQAPAEEPIPAASPPHKPLMFPALSGLYKELLGKFGTGHYWHLSDGGHSENSGALSLLERGCDLILVADNAQDEDYHFSDLEIFIRTARTDIGMEVVVEEDLPADLAHVADCFFNGGDGDWRARVRERDCTAFALLLKARDIPHRANGGWEVRHEGETRIVWLKPNRFANLPADIATYAELNPDFPQQSTANQFFDEAQWESYRRLGFEMGTRLFHRRDTLADYLPVIFRKPSPPAPMPAAPAAVAAPSVAARPATTRTKAAPATRRPRKRAAKTPAA